MRSGSVRRGAAIAPGCDGGCPGFAIGLLTLALTLVAARHVQAQPASPVWFDIPSQSLASALDAYSTATGKVAVYNGQLAVGRVSGAVKGHLASELALRVLLKDSGLVAQHTSPDAFVVLAAPDEAKLVRQPSAIALAALSHQGAIERRYSAMMQQGITAALCARPETRPGAYRAAISLWIGETGAVTRVKLLSSTGDPERDAAITALAGRAAINEPPPARMAQPFTMVVLPQNSGGSIACPAVAGDDRHG